MDEILAQLFPQAPSYFPGLLGQEQANLLQQQAQRQGLLGIGMGLLQAAAPSTTRPSLGAGIAQGLATGQQMAQNVYAQRLQEAQIAQKLAEQQRLMREQEVARTLLPQILRPGEQTPTFYGQPTTFPQRDDEGNILPGAGVQTGQPQINFNTMQALLTQAPGAAAQILPIVEAYRKMSAPERVTLKKGETILEQTPFGLRPVAGGAEPEYREVGGALYEMVPGQAPKVVINPSGKLTGDYANVSMGLFGTSDVAQLPTGGFQQVQDQVLANKRAGAQTIIEKTSGLAAGELVKGAIERANASLNNATAASQTLQTISDIRPALEQGVMAGPLSQQTAVVARLASTLGVTGQSTQDTLNRTAEAMRGLAQLELQAAEQMRGQGAITEGERGLIARAAAGNLATMTAGEVRTLLNAMERTAKFKIQSYNQNLGILRRALPEESRQFVDVYPTIGVETQPRTSIGSAGSAARAAGLVREE